VKDCPTALVLKVQITVLSSLPSATCQYVPNVKLSAFRLYPSTAASSRPPRSSLTQKGDNNCNSKFKSRHAGGKTDLLGVVPERSDDLFDGSAAGILALSVSTNAEFSVAVSSPTHLSTMSSGVLDFHQLQLLVQQRQCTILKLQNQLNALCHLLVSTRRTS
jgi:hypothetical protein